MWLRFLFFISLLVSASSNASEADDVSWLKLLHYEKSGKKYVSLVENDEFFISSGGRYNHLKEFEQTVEQFNKVDDVKKCDFPARFMYLKNKGLVKGDLSKCGEFLQFVDDLQAKSVTMIFTNAYMGSPGSMFGHTLFRIDTKRKGTQLLAHGANFGADTGDESGVLYALKGLWGGYYGVFGINPYYDVINLYNNIENRDIWEYELNLSDEEIDMFVKHIWEMRNAKIRYYFANKNCSYILLLTLEAIKTELDLSREFGWYVLPIETLKKVDSVNGLIKNVNYRPSRQSKLKYRYKQMNEAQEEGFVKIIASDEFDLGKLEDGQKADVLETAYQYIQYKYVEGDLELKDYRKKSFKLLKERSKINDNELYFEELKEGENPLYTHKSRSVGINFGAKNGEVFQEISYKPVYNTLMEDSYGLLKGSAINFFETRVRHYDNNDKYVLDEFNLFSIKSMSGADVMFKPLSYDIELKYKEVYNPKNGDQTGSIILETGVGQSYNLSDNFLMYVISMPNVVYGGGVDENGYVGFGVKAGVYYNKGKYRFLANVMKNYTSSNVMNGEGYFVEGAYGISSDMMLYADFKKNNYKASDDDEFMFGVRFGF